MIGGGDPFYLKFWVTRPPLESDTHPSNATEAAITPKRYDIRCQLLLITNRKLHMGF